MFADLFEHSWAYELGGINVVSFMLLCVARNITNLRKDIMLNGMGSIYRNHWTVSFQMNDTVVRKALQLHKQLHTNCQTNNTSLEHVHLYNRLALEKRAVVFEISSDLLGLISPNFILGAYNRCGMWNYQSHLQSRMLNVSQKCISWVIEMCRIKPNW